MDDSLYVPILKKSHAAWGSLQTTMNLRTRTNVIISWRDKFFPLMTDLSDRFGAGEYKRSENLHVRSENHDNVCTKKTSDRWDHYMKKTFLVVSAVAILLSCTSVGLAEIKIAILAKRGADVVQQRWSALGNYLAQKMDEEVTFVPLKFTEVMNWTWNNSDQFLFANSWFYVRAKVKRGAKALVTVKNKGSGVLFGGVIFSKKGSGIDQLSALPGKIVMCPKFSSAGGWIFQKGVMVKAGINPEKDCKQLLEGQTHAAVVIAVKDGKADAGTVRTNVLERMSEEGKIDISRFTIIHPVNHPGFPEKCSTPLYPTWPVASLRNTPPERAARLKEALLSIPDNHPALQPCKVERFVDALDYGPLEQLLRFLNAPPFRGR